MGDIRRWWLSQKVLVQTPGEAHLQSSVEQWVTGSWEWAGQQQDQQEDESTLAHVGALG